ncbi:MAG: SH3 domain-containing protein [Saprospiraceae bacterium]|nr:SH3 domain-containing protein [Lewinellaceae bacterium]MBP6810583.1 SH3 domain-containing protein [Saprospiraceae bacterium]
MKIPKAEILILLAFLVFMSFWAMSKCSERRADSVHRARDVEDTDSEERPVKRDTVVVQSAPKTPPTQIKEDPAVPPVTQSAPTAVPAPRPGVAPRRPSLSTETPAAAPPPSTSGSTLFVTIDGLKVRKEPGLKGETVAELKLYEPVTFLNKKTDWTQEISLGYEKVTDHWVKVRTQSGKEGWVFGAGVHFYKTKRQGVLEDKKPAETTPKKKN